MSQQLLFETEAPLYEDYWQRCTKCQKSAYLDAWHVYGDQSDDLVFCPFCGHGQGMDWRTDSMPVQTTGLIDGDGI